MNSGKNQQLRKIVDCRMLTDISGISVFYETLGEGLPLICIHGYGVDHRSIKSGLERVFKDVGGFQRIYFDLPGMGQSDAHPQVLSSDDMLELTFQFIDDRIGSDRPFALAGYSYGGYLARAVMSRMQERIKGVLLICPVIRFRRQGRCLPEFKCCEQDDAFINSLTPDQFATIDQFVTIQTREVWDQYQAHIHPSLDMADSALLDRIRDIEFCEDPDAPDQPAYEGPGLILLGRYDVAVGYEDAWKIYHRFPNGDFVVLSRAGHLLHMEQPELFQFHVKDWLARVLNRSV